MVLLGVSWSSVAAEMRDVLYFTDIIEAPGWELAAAEPFRQPRLSVHNLRQDESLADVAAFTVEWGAAADAAIRATGTPWFSMHLGFSAERVRFDGNMHPLSETLKRDDLFERIVSSVRRIQSLISVPLLLENLDYCPGGAYEHVCDPAFIRAVLDATDTGLLLDLAHLRVSASWFGMSAEDMLLELPLDRVVEIHVSSPRPVSENDNRLRDVHEELTEDDLGLLRDVLARTPARLVVLEYRRDEERLRTQLLQLGRLLKRRPRPRPCTI